MSLYPERSRLKDEIVARVAAGETVKAISAQLGGPSKSALHNWRRADPAFAAALAAARLRGYFRRRLAFDEATAAAFLARLAAGARVEDLLDRPGMPSQKTYQYWRRSQGAFQEALWALRYARRSGASHGRWRAWDEAVADRITLLVRRGAVFRELLGSDPELPCLAVAARWRREHPEWDFALRIAMGVGRRARGPRGCTPGLVAEICDRVAAGASLRRLAACADMPCARTLYAWMARRPEFAAAVQRAKAARRQAAGRVRPSGRSPSSRC
ncbi:MAG: hypothetical protein ABI655_01085 [Phenylobacterium sp.]